MHACKGKLFICNFCTYTSKSELKAHTSKHNIAHSNIYYNDYLAEVYCAIFALKQIGLILLGMQHLNEDDEWRKWMDRTFVTS
jgi:hypothetical protein